MLPLGAPILLSSLAVTALSWLLLNWLGHRRGVSDLVGQLLLRVRLSVSATVLVAGLSWWAFELGSRLGAELPRSGEQVRNALISLGLMWTLLRCKRVLLRHVQDHQGLWPPGNSRNAYVFDLSNKLITALVVLIGVVQSLRLLGVSAGVLFAASGFSAAALGFGARTLIENLLSGVMLYLNRPFVVGDQVEIPTLKLLGTVSSIGPYYSELLTPDRQPLYVPNAVFAREALINSQRRAYRELLLEALLRLSDHPRALGITDALRDQLAQTPGVAADQPQRVHVRSIDATGIRLVLQCFCSSDLDQALELQQRLLLLMTSTIEQHGAALAQPMLPPLAQVLPPLRSTLDGPDRP